MFDRKVKSSDKRMNLNRNFHGTTELANLNEIKMNLSVKFANLAGKSYIIERFVRCQKGVNPVQQCSVENREGRYRQRLLHWLIVPFWFSTEHL